METWKVLVLLAFSLVPHTTSAYGPDTTHAGLTYEIVKFYNERNLHNPLSASDSSSLIQGSIHEDNDLRFLRHFYDPVNRRGLTFFSLFNNGDPWPSAKEWAQAPSLQEPNRTWQYALRKYKGNEREEALFALGHILHLIEDMTVPDHTRDDPHPPYLDESPYENWTRQYGSPDDGISGLGDYRLLADVISQESLSDSFEEVAQFSNKNFFSKDTANLILYREPIVQYFQIESTKSREDVIFAYGAIGGQNFRLAEVRTRFDFYAKNFVDEFILDDSDHLVMEDYWQILSRKAIEAGVGVMELFFREAEKAEEVSVVQTPSEASFFIDRHFFAKMVPASASPQVRRDVPPREREGRLLSPFSDIAGIGFSIPVAEVLHVHPRDIETGVLHSAPSQGLPSDLALSPSESGDEDEVFIPDPSDQVSEVPSEDGDHAEEAVPQTPPIFESPDVRAPTILDAGYVGPLMLLTKAGSPYHITRSMIVPHNEVLRIEPGVIVKIAPGIYVDLNGTFDARGTLDEPIIITSIYDDEHGGDTNGDGLCVAEVEVGDTWCPPQREWRRFGFFGPTMLEYVTMRYGGSSPGSGVPDSFRAMINIGNHADVSLRDSVIEKTPHIGIYAEGSRALMERITIRDCAQLHTRFAGILLRRGSPVLRDSTVERCGVGVRLEASEGAVVAGNQFLNNTNIPIQHSQAGTVTMVGNSGSGNRWNGIAFPVVASGQSISLEPNPLPFIMPPAFWTPVQGRLLVSPGTTIKIGTTPMRVQGALELLGTEQSPVIVTSIEDDSDGNDAAGDGASTNQPRVGIQRFGANATTTFIYTEFRAGITVSGP